MRRRSIGLLVLVLVFGLTLVGCDNGTTSTDVLDGTAWEITSTDELFVSFGDNTEYTTTAGVIFNSPNLMWWYTYTPNIPEQYANYVPRIIKGTYTVSGNDLTISVSNLLPELGLGGRVVSGVIEGAQIAFQDHEETVMYDKQY
jgi:hypothetical protein